MGTQGMYGTRTAALSIASFMYVDSATITRRGYP